MSKLQKAVFAAGCFWGVQSFFDALDGVKQTAVGYTGGLTKNPTYEQVCTGDTGHAEALEITFDPNMIGYEELVKKFFELHDPTQLNRQGPDVGTQYRSAIFFENQEQREVAEKIIKKLELEKKYSKPIVTEIIEAGEFYAAEEYHQKYFEKRGIAPSCHF
jgi:methionine-S-sulfoxide reductase